MAGVGYAILAQASRFQAAAWRAAITSQGAVASEFDAQADLRAEVTRLVRLHGPAPLLVVDVARLAAARESLRDFARWRWTTLRESTLLITAGHRSCVHDTQRAWARSIGAADLLPAASPTRWRKTLAPALPVIAAALGIVAPDERKLELFLKVLLKDQTAEGGIDEVHARLAMIDRLGIDPERMARDMAGPRGVQVRDRTYRMTAFPECFVGEAAVAWMVEHRGLTPDIAVLAGRAMEDCGLIYHVVREQPFRDGPFFYRFASSSPAIERLDLGEVVDRMRQPTGVGIQDRSYHGTNYRMCFVGSDAVEWLRGRFKLNLNDALTVGQRLVDLRVFHHVTDAHGFRDGNYYYRFHEDESAA